MRRAVFVSLSLLLAFAARAQPGVQAYDSLEAARAKAWADSVLAAARTRERPERVWTVAPILWYTPETGLAFGAGGIWYFRPGSAGRGVRPGRTPSRLSGLALYTLEGQVIIENRGELYTDADRWRLRWTAGWSRYPFSFFGIGGETEKENEERYTNTYPLVEATAYRGLTERFFLGLGGWAEHNRFSDFAEGGLLEAGGVPGQDGGWNTGFGPALLYDVRDNVLMSCRGWYAAAHATFFGPALGGEHAYADLELDLRGFIPLGRERPSPHVLALQGYAHWTPGSPPFHRLALLGGPERLRGYFQGRYRDAFLLQAQAEWRFPVWRFLRGAAFVAAGDVAPDPGAWRADALKISGGLGLRLLLDPEDRSALRFDAALTREGEPGFYLQFTEAF